MHTGKVLKDLSCSVLFLQMQVGLERFFHFPTTISGSYLMQNKIFWILICNYSKEDSTQSQEMDCLASFSILAQIDGVECLCKEEKSL